MAWQGNESHAGGSLFGFLYSGCGGSTRDSDPGHVCGQGCGCTDAGAYADVNRLKGVTIILLAT